MSADRSERNDTVPYEDLIKPICQIDGAENLAAGHGIQYHVFARIRRLSRDRGVIQLVKSMHNAPTAGGCLHTESRTRMWQDTFANMACLTALEAQWEFSPERYRHTRERYRRQGFPKHEGLPKTVPRNFLRALIWAWRSLSEPPELLH